VNLELRIKNWAGQVVSPGLSALNQKSSIINKQRVREGIRTLDPRNHNPMLYPTELLSPAQFVILYLLFIICNCENGNVIWEVIRIYLQIRDAPGAARAMRKIFINSIRTPIIQGARFFKAVGVTPADWRQRLISMLFFSLTRRRLSWHGKVSRIKSRRFSYWEEIKLKTKKYPPGCKQ
jgi:hypothetical protein